MIPERLRHLPRDPRGYVIPYIVLRDSDGRAHFTVNDTKLRDRCMYQHLCPICGDKLLRGRWFLGGPGSAFHPDGAYIDTPMHHECMRYAVTTCPYICLGTYRREVGARTLDPAKVPGLQVLVDETMDPNRQQVFVAVMCVAQEILDAPTFSPHLRPKRPYLRVEFWKHGRQLREADAVELFSDEMRGHYEEVKRGIARRRSA